MQKQKAPKTTGAKSGSRAACTAQNETNPLLNDAPRSARRAAVVRARISAGKAAHVLAQESPEAAQAQAQAAAHRAAIRAGISARRMARVLRALRAQANRAAHDAQTKQAGGPKEFGDRFRPEFAEEFLSGALAAWSQGAARYGISRAGYEQSNLLFQKMSSARADSALLLSLPAEILEHDDAEEAARLLSETRRGIILTAVELRSAARAAYDNDLEKAARLVGKKTRAINTARRAFTRDSRIVRRAALCALARLKGQPFEFAIARGVSRSGARGGRASDARTPWQTMLAQHDETRARLGLPALTLAQRSAARD